MKARGKFSEREFFNRLLGEMAASGFYGRWDEAQKQQVKAFIYQHYGVIQ